MNVINPKGIPFNVPVAITYDHYGKKTLTTATGRFFDVLILIAIIHSYNFNGYQFSMLATERDKKDLPIFFDASLSPSLMPDYIIGFKVHEWTDLPLFIGWKYTTPLLASLIKKYDYKNNRAPSIDRPDLGRD